MSTAESSSGLLAENRIIANTYVVEKKIGSGAFGEIYEGCVVNQSAKVAIKVEASRPKHDQLHHEAKVYKHLNGGCGIPKIFYYGSEGSLNFLVMDLLGPSLECLFNYCGRKFSLKTVLMLADSMLQRIEYVHCKHFVHRDIKPDNFVMGLKANATRLFLIDYGLSNRYRDVNSQMHIPYCDKKNLTGTARYATINTHLGAEQSRRDDLESLGYVLIYFLKGELPWQGFKASTRDAKYKLILEKKMATGIDVLCKGLPTEFMLYMNYVRSLRFDERPDYTHLRRLFKNVMIKSHCVDDRVFDWMLLYREKHPDAAETKVPPRPEQSPRKAEGKSPTAAATFSPRFPERPAKNPALMDGTDASPLLGVSSTSSLRNHSSSLAKQNGDAAAAIDVFCTPPPPPAFPLAAAAAEISHCSDATNGAIFDAPDAPSQPHSLSRFMTANHSLRSHAKLPSVSIAAAPSIFKHFRTDHHLVAMGKGVPAAAAVPPPSSSDSFKPPHS